MSRLKAIKLRINSIKNTQQITKAMKMVSAAKLKKAQQSIDNARPYAHSLREMVYNLYETSESEENQFFTTRNRGKALVLVITTDKGLCGALNTNLVKSIPSFVENELKPKYDDYSFIAFGKKGSEFLKRGNYDIGNSYADVKEAHKKQEILTFIRSAIKDYSEKKINALYLLYNHFVSLVKQAPIITKVFPISRESIDVYAIKEKYKTHPKSSQDLANKHQYIYEPNHKAVLDALIPLYAETYTMTALFDNLASEHSARMVAMDAASKNSAEILKRLSLEFNRARQALITKELIEIVSGAESIA